ncbi:MAG: nucleotidyltransferase family protein [Planctomycetia bacterium]|nr:nucleotidyltransferase family protein [Planctomycetia bacterium]
MALQPTQLHDFSWERMIAAVEDVRQRASRAAGALRQAGVPFVVVGGHAVASWVARVDKEAVRNTKDVDLLVRREDFSRVTEALQAAGFVHHTVADVDLFLDGPQGSVRSAVHILFACEMVRPGEIVANPDVAESEPGPDFPVPTLDALVRMKLNSFRLKDQVHMLDLLEIGLVDASWCDRLPPELAARLRELIETRAREL